MIRQMLNDGTFRCNSVKEIICSDSSFSKWRLGQPNITELRQRHCTATITHCNTTYLDPIFVGSHALSDPKTEM